jgi:hypothetical protein
MRGGTDTTTTTVIVLAIDTKDAGEAVPRTVGNPWIYVPVTPLSLDRARGVVAHELIVTKTMRDSPELSALVKACTPCFATTGGIEAALTRADVNL